MKDRDDLDLHRAAKRADLAMFARGAGRVLGILFGLAVSLYGGALYMLRCFDTCPTDPAEDAVARLLPASLVAFGIAVAVAAACVATRAARAGLGIVAGLGCLTAVFGVAAAATVPRITAPGDHGSAAVFGVVALVVGGVMAAAALAARRRVGAPPATDQSSQRPGKRDGST